MKRLFFVFLFTFLLFHKALFGQQGEQIQEPVSVSQKDDQYNKMRAVYGLLKGSDLGALRDACRERGLPTDGDEAALKRRILNDEMLKSRISFEARSAESGTFDIILNNADFIRSEENEAGEEIIILNGNVDVNYGGRRIQADEVRINVDREIVRGSGCVRFAEGKNVYTGESFYYNQKTDEGIFFRAKTSIEDFIYTGSMIRRIQGTDKFVSDDLTLTTCNIRYPHYRIDAERLFFYDSERALVKDASLYFGQDDVLNLPYMYRNLKDHAFKSSVQFRERSGLVLQNTYTPVKTDEREIVLKGDFYERLGIYAGAEYNSSYPLGETDLRSSAALSNDVYYYDEVTEHWSPLGPPDAEDYSITRSGRYNIGLYQKIVIEKAYTNTAEINLSHITDPYYEYDFERRSQRFDLFDVIGQAESDFPRKGSGYTWLLNDTFQYNRLTLSLQNSVRFEPQRNTDEDIVSLPDYYEYRLYTVAAPQVSAYHTADILTGSDSALFSDLTYTGTANYAHILYYNENERIESQVHKADAALDLTRDYFLGNYIRITPEIEGGAQGQAHVDPNSSETADDRQNTYAYGRTTDEFQLGPESLYALFTYDLKYKLAGPDDLYTYHRFRVHQLGFLGFATVYDFTETLETAYDLRPVYDWESGSYQAVEFDRTRFDPLKNTLTYAPTERIIISDIFIYDISSLRPTTNQLTSNLSSRDIDLLGNTLVVSWGLGWNHYFQNPTLDTFDSLFQIDLSFRRYLRTYFKVLSRNESLWRYFPDAAEERGVEAVNPVTDLLKSFNFFNRDDRLASLFKMKRISFGFVRGLHDWDLKFDYTGNRELSYDGSRYIWDNTYTISIGLREVKSVDVHTKIKEQR